MTVKLIVDSSAGLGSELADRWGIAVVPFSIGWDGQDHDDGSLGPGFYRQLESRQANPHTAAPNPTAFGSAIRDVLREGYEAAVIVTPTPNMTGVHSHASVAAREFANGTVAVVDSGQGAGAQALVAIRAAEAARGGASLDEVAATARTTARRTEIHMAVSTLKFLRRSGRISAAQATMGAMIKMRPILTFVNHRLQVVAKPRTMQRAIQWLENHYVEAGRQAEHVLVMYADDSQRAESFAARLQDLLAPAGLDLSPVSDVVGGNTGPGLLGAAVRWKDDKGNPFPHRIRKDTPKGRE